MSSSKKRMSILESLESRQLLSAAPLVMGYLVDYKIGDTSNSVFSENSSGTVVHDKLDWSHLNQVNYFALLPNADAPYDNHPAAANSASSDGGLQALTDSGYDPAVQLPKLVADAHSHGAKVFVTVGGGDANAIYDMDALVNTSSAWTKFASNIKAFVSKYSLDGVDLDWEPTAQAGFNVSSTQIQNFGKLITDIKSANPSLVLTADALGDAVDVSDRSDPALMLNATAVQKLDRINVEAYPVGSKAESDAVMSDWATYLKSGKDLDGKSVSSSVSKLQYGLDIAEDDSSNKPSGVIEGKVDVTISKGYGGIFVFELDADTGSPSVISRIGAQIAKDTGGSTGGGGTGNISGSVKSTSGAGIANVTIWLDADNDSVMDPNEKTAVTASDGSYSFTNIAPGAYIIRQKLSAGQTQTSPSGGYGIHITVSSGSNLSGENFTDSVASTTASPLKGTVIGSTNALKHAKSGHAASNAFDGKTSTTFESTKANDNWIGLDLGKAYHITQIKYAADSANPSFMEGGVFQISDHADFSKNVVNLYSVANTSTPSTSLKSVTVSSSKSYRYVRYLAPANSFGEVAEIQFFGTKA